MSDHPPPPPSNRVQIWMPIYIGDYLRGTIGLTTSEHGAYLLSMFAYWDKGESLTTAELRAITGKDFERIVQFYIIMDNRWHHKRIDIELNKARDNFLKRKAKSEKGVAARRAMGQIPKSSPDEPPD